MAELEAELDTNLQLLSNFQARKANLQVEIKKNRCYCYCDRKAIIRHTGKSGVEEKSF